MKHKDVYLVAYYHLKPNDPKRTSDKGYMSNPENSSYEESINITRGLKPRDQQTSGIILNLSNMTIVKNTFKFKQDVDFPTLLAHYQEGYAKYLNPVLALLYPEAMQDVDVHTEEEKTAS